MKLSGEAKDEFLNESREQFFRTICHKMSQTGRIRLFFLEFSSRRVASAMCFDYRSSRLLYNSGLDPKYREYSVGIALTGLCIKDAIENDIDYFDFLRGDEPYKYDLGGKDTVLYRMVLEKK
jgi:CelD/BcsL family acetyltransferase involved in cellulose biosynthesis